MKVNMDKLDLKKCKTDKEEYDKAIRSLDYKIVETSVEMYNSKNHNAQFSNQDDENSRTSQLNFKIQQYEEEKANLTKEFWKKIVAIKDNPFFAFHFLHSPHSIFYSFYKQVIFHSMFNLSCNII